MDDTFSAGLSWEAINIMLGAVGVVLSIVAGCLLWSLRKIRDSLDGMRETVAVLVERLRRGGDELGRVREDLDVLDNRADGHDRRLDDHERRLTVLAPEGG